MKNGFFISCHMNKEKQAFKEFVGICTQNLCETNLCKQNLSKNETLTIKSDFQKFLSEELKKYKKKSFIILEEYKSFIFVQNLTMIPAKQIYEEIRFLQKIMQKESCDNADSLLSQEYSLSPIDFLNQNLSNQTPTIKTNKNIFQIKNSKFIHRIIPLEVLFQFNQFSIESFINSKKAIIESGTYKIEYEGRLNENKSKVFEIIIPMISAKVDLKNPEILIVVETYKGWIGMSVIYNNC